MNIELRSEARRDLIDAAVFFDSQRDGLGDYFIDCVFRDLKSLEDEAGIHAKSFGFHRKLASKFPFAIYYLVEKDVADVVAVLDCRRDPELAQSALHDRKK